MKKMLLVAIFAGLVGSISAASLVVDNQTNKTYYVQTKQFACI